MTAARDYRKDIERERKEMLRTERRIKLLQSRHADQAAYVRKMEESYKRWQAEKHAA